MAEGKESGLEKIIEKFNTALNKVGTTVCGYIVGGIKTKKGKDIAGLIPSAFDYLYHGIIGSMPYRDTVGGFIGPAYYKKEKAAKYRNTLLMGTMVASCFIMPYFAPVLGLWCLLSQYFKASYEPQNKDPAPAAAKA